MYDACAEKLLDALSLDRAKASVVKAYALRKPRKARTKASCYSHRLLARVHIDHALTPVSYDMREVVLFVADVALVIQMKVSP